MITNNYNVLLRQNFTFGAGEKQGSKSGKAIKTDAIKIGKVIDNTETAKTY